MERLSHSINYAMDVGLWEPIILSRGGPTLSHLFFADDLIILCKAAEHQATLVRVILDQFSRFSGHRVNSNKTKVFFSSNVEDESAEKLCSLLNCQRAMNLGNFLSLPLFHTRVMKSTFQFIIDKDRNKLTNWTVSNLPLVGRVTLAKATLMAIPNYFMQTVAIPKGVCDQIEQIAHQFIWGGTKENLKAALFNWKFCFQLITQGGHGIRPLQTQNEAFLTKLGYNLLMQPEALWVKVMLSNYKMNEMLLVQIKAKNGYFIWKPLSQVWDIGDIGDGRDIKFWFDNLVSGTKPLAEITNPTHITKANMVVRDLVLNNEDWNTSPLNQLLNEDIVKLLMAIPPLRDDMGTDQPVWRGSDNGICTVKAAFNELNSTQAWANSIKANQSTNHPSTSVHNRRQRWQPPRVGMVKLNTDGALDTKTGNARGGGVFRDKEGQWLGGFNRNIGRCSAFHVELWVLLDGLTLAWDRGIRDIKVELDNKEAVDILQDAHICTRSRP
ncbi:hypothetical protein F3Y22_tig00112293pilonHSYRG00090 [Hibiscus syriacus]|uniref:RNase H type-1 domain-containing protein n=1 Tax=Hibiscus syriacus TaxID=106335 RepID=A0A6A2X1Y4_HIBSY|nr:hypothetical protein F3Y22_tig00112293pilonHSYRG00090 [Hibiscus syriacus]